MLTDWTGSSGFHNNLTRPDTGEGGSLPRWWRCLFTIGLITISDYHFWCLFCNCGHLDYGEHGFDDNYCMQWRYQDHHSSWFVSFPPAKSSTSVDFILIWFLIFTSSAGHSTLAMSTASKLNAKWGKVLKFFFCQSTYGRILSPSAAITANAFVKTPSKNIGLSRLALQSLPLDQWNNQTLCNTLWPVLAL